MRLRRVDCSEDGLRRVRRGRGFSYTDANGAPVRDAETLDRIRELAIPPAWRDVWICTRANGHLQATGYDAAGRKQYRYHDAWRLQRDQAKFLEMEDFARALPKLRRSVDDTLASGTEPTKERVSAFATRLLDIGMFRVGGEESAEEFGHYGLATLNRGHLELSRDQAVFDYPAKSGVQRRHAVSDPVTVEFLRTLTRRRSGPDELLVYRSGREWRALGSDGINDFIKAGAGDAFSAKDFRTWNATVLAAADLAASGEIPAAKTTRERVVKRVVKDVSELLGNTPAVARASYIDPRVLDRYRSGQVVDVGSRSGLALDGISGNGRRRLELAVLDLIG